MTFVSDAEKRPHRRAFLEVCVESVASARAAIAGGADQLELCSALSLGGLTPPAGLVAMIVDIAHAANVPVRAMVRPRPGDFRYDEDMLATAIAESRYLLRENVDGLVFGAVRGDALCDRSIVHWRDVVRTMPGGDTAGLTLHRAIDMVADPVAAVDTAVLLGFDQILTSGGAPVAMDGSAQLAAMHEAAGGRLRVVAASGITPATLAPLIAAARLDAVHASARSAGPVPGDPAFGFGDTPTRTDESVVRRLRAILDGEIGRGC